MFPSKSYSTPACHCGQPAMTTPRSHRETEEAAAIAEAAPGPSPVAIGLSNLAGVPADMSSYLWGPKDEEVAAEEEEPLPLTRMKGNDVRYVGGGARQRQERGGECVRANESSSPCSEHNDLDSYPLPHAIPPPPLFSPMNNTHGTVARERPPT